MVWGMSGVDSPKALREPENIRVYHSTVPREFLRICGESV